MRGRGGLIKTVGVKMTMGVGNFRVLAAATQGLGHGWT